MQQLIDKNFQISINDKSSKESMSKIIRKSLSGESQAPVTMEHRWYISLPKLEDYCFHLMGKV